MIVDKYLVLAKLAENKETLKSKYFVDTLFLFGSVAREKTNPNDIDFLVKYNSDIGIYEHIALKQYLEDMFGIRVDLVINDELPENFAQNIADDLIAV